MNTETPFRAQPHICAECDERSVVALNGRWLCLAHFDDAMKAIGEAIRVLRATLDLAITTDDPA